MYAHMQIHIYIYTFDIMASSGSNHHSSEKIVHPDPQQTPHRFAIPGSTLEDRESVHAHTIVRLQAALAKLEQTLQNTHVLSNREKLVSIRDELMCMIGLAQSYNPYDYHHIDHFYASLSYIVSGTVKWRQVDRDVFSTNVKSMFPFYMNMRVVRGYRVTR